MGIVFVFLFSHFHDSLVQDHTIGYTKKTNFLIFLLSTLKITALEWVLVKFSQRTLEAKLLNNNR